MYRQLRGTRDHKNKIYALVIEWREEAMEQWDGRMVFDSQFYG